MSDLTGAGNASMPGDHPADANATIAWTPGSYSAFFSEEEMAAEAVEESFTPLAEALAPEPAPYVVQEPDFLAPPEPAVAPLVVEAAVVIEPEPRAPEPMPKLVAPPPTPEPIAPPPTVEAVAPAPAPVAPSPASEPVAQQPAQETAVIPPAPKPAAPPPVAESVKAITAVEPIKVQPVAPLPPVASPAAPLPAAKPQTLPPPLRPERTPAPAPPPPAAVPQTLPPPLRPSHAPASPPPRAAAPQPLPPAAAPYSAGAPGPEATSRPGYVAQPAPQPAPQPVLQPSLGSRLEVINREGWSKEYLLQRSLVYVGSQPGSDIYLPQPEVAPRHIQLVPSPVNRAGYRLINFSSAPLNLRESGGASRAVPPRATAELSDGDTVTLAGYELVFRSGQVQSAAIQARVELAGTRLELDRPLEGSLYVRNTGDKAGVQFEVQVQGFDTHFVQIDPGPVLFPGVEKRVAFQLTHPRQSTPLAGDYTLTLVVTAPGIYPGESAIVSANFAVAPFFAHTVRFIAVEAALADYALR